MTRRAFMKRSKETVLKTVFAMTEFAEEEKGEQSGSSTEPCEPSCELKLKSKAVVDLGKFVPPAWKEQAASAKLTKRFEEITNELLEIRNEMSANQGNADLLIAKANRIKALVNEAEELMGQWEKLGFTVVPMTPIPAGPKIEIELSSKPKGLDGVIGSETISIRASGDQINPLIGSFGGENQMEATGKCTFTATYTLSGNYGEVLFVGTVWCCDIGSTSNEMRLTVTGMCKGEAQRALDTVVNNASAQFERDIAAILSLMQLIAAMGTFLFTMLVSAPPAALVAIVAAFLLCLAFNIAQAVIEGKRRRFNAMKQAFLDAAQPYINKLPPCP